MSIRIMARVLDSPAIRHPGKLLTLLILANYADDEGSNIFPSVTTVARRTRQSTRTVQRHLREFENDEIIKCVQYENPVEKKQRRYRINLGKLPIETTGDIMSPHPPHGVTPCHPPGDIMSHNGCHGVTQNRQVPVSSTRQSSEVVELGLKEVEITLKIYEAYPVKVAKEKALKSIRRAVKEFGAEHILVKTQKFREVWGKAEPEEMRFCPHPTTWFNQNRFNDDPKTWKRDEKQRVGKPVIDRNEGTFNADLPLGAYADHVRKQQ